LGIGGIDCRIFGGKILAAPVLRHRIWVPAQFEQHVANSYQAVRQIPSRLLVTGIGAKERFADCYVLAIAVQSVTCASHAGEDFTLVVIANLESALVIGIQGEILRKSSTNRQSSTVVFESPSQIVHIQQSRS